MLPEEELCMGLLRSALRGLRRLLAYMLIDFLKSACEKDKYLPSFLGFLECLVHSLSTSKYSFIFA